VGLALLFVFPYVWMFAASFRPVQEIFQYMYPLSWKSIVPLHPTLGNYRALFATEPFGRYVFNSLLVASAVTVLDLFVNSLAAYAFARIAFPGRDLLFVILLATLIIPFEAIMVPLYIIVRTLGWIDTYLGLIVPSAARVFSIFLLRQFMLGIPRELDDAARIDGCSHWGIYRTIVLPLTTPALISLGIITFHESWDAFTWPLIATNRQDYRLIQVAIATFSQESVILWDRIFAASSLASVLPIALFLAFQRYYVRGIATTGLKG
jgi:multiple sugar transport system permease protein